MIKFRNRGLRKRRDGFTIIEVVLSLVLASILLIGLVTLVVHMKEIMWINWQLRTAEEFGLGYVNYFTKYMRNGYDPEITNVGYPSRARVQYIDPDDSQNSKKLIEFERSSTSGLPTIKVNGIRYSDDQFPPIGDARDRFFMEPRSFRITYNDLYPNATNARFDSSFITIEFSITYKRNGVGGHGAFSRDFERTLNFEGSAYVMNWNWPGKDDLRGF